MNALNALIQAYRHLHSTVDRIATSIELRDKLRSLLPADSQSLSDDEILRRLFNLRKSGHLPKHFRGV
jgi:hypothetical protein